MRAITESIQSRLSFIHGGRDDLIIDYNNYQNMTELERRKRFDEALIKINKSSRSMLYKDIPEKIWKFNDLDELLKLLLGHLKALNFDFVLQAIHTKPEDLLQVVKILIPSMEFFTVENKRVGPRLNKFLNSIENDSIRRA